ncbi:hypothetical protein IT401_01865 [Candidatus Nomurabacteria bacterium]|nr:hypothetical protein [Candidatus Nomurabacteria bacterium]
MRYSNKQFPAPLTLLIGLFVFSIGVFTIRNSRDILFGTPLSVQIASDGTTLNDGFLPFSGNAGHARTLSVNGRPLTIDREGNFSDGLLLSPGYNVVEVASENQFGKQSVRTYHLVFDQEHSVARALDKETYRY